MAFSAICDLGAVSGALALAVKLLKVLGWRGMDL